jgi:hypothetical protein
VTTWTSVSVGISALGLDVTTRWCRDLAMNYRIEESDYASGSHYEFTAVNVGSAAPTLVLTVSPDGRETWRGEFLGGQDSYCGVASTPDPDVVLVVARGVGYLVPVESPDEYVVVPLRPIVDVVVGAQSRAVLCVGLTSIAAIGERGAIAWQSSRLVADGFDEVRIASTLAVARGRSPNSADQIEVTVDLQSGQVIRN